MAIAYAEDYSRTVYSELPVRYYHLRESFTQMTTTDKEAFLAMLGDDVIISRLPALKRRVRYTTLNTESNPSVAPIDVIIVRHTIHELFSER